ncbi:MAG: DegV family protein [Actinomycetia bacterium]|nr:DegV family protein [Actinomycetes bacterium]
MDKVAIVTDSTADIPDDLQSKYDISIVPLYMHFQGKEYKDRANITNKQIYDLLDKNVEVKTSAPSPKDFLSLYSDLISNKGANIIYSIHISSKLSNTVDSALMASKKFPETRIEIFDSKSVTMGLGLPVLTAARMASAGKDAETIKDTINYLIDKSIFLSTVENFEYLLRGGRVSGLKRLLNMALKVRPVLVMDQGKVKVSKISRTRKSSILQIAEDFKSIYGNKGAIILSIIYGADLDAAHNLNQLIKKEKSLNIKETIFTEITPVIGTHSGPSIVGLAAIPAIE